MRNLRRLTNRKYFSVSNKHPLRRWKFRVGDKVIVTAGRSVDAPERKGFNGAKGTIEKINKDPRNPSVEISGISSKRMRTARDGSRQPHLVPLPIHISKVRLAREVGGIDVPTPIKWQEYIAKLPDGTRKMVRQRVFVTEKQERVADPYTRPPTPTPGPFRLGVTQKAMAHKQTYVPPTRGFSTFASGPVLDDLYLQKHRQDVERDVAACGGLDFMA